MSPWLYQGFPLHVVPPQAIGFLYRLTHITTGKKYLGKKSFFTNRTIRETGKANRTKSTGPSDWRSYCSSSDTVKTILESEGPGAFTKEIIKIVERDLAYEETKMLFQADVLEAKLPNGDFEYLNLNIDGKWFRRPTPPATLQHHPASFPIP